MVFHSSARSGGEKSWVIALMASSIMACGTVLLA
jgi:hypothetical protein